MSNAMDNLLAAQNLAMASRPKIGGFPFMAEVFRRAGITRNLWSLPSCQSVFLTKFGTVVIQEQPLIAGIADVPKFNREALIKALRLDQAGDSSFPEFLKASWEAGVVGYDVDFELRRVTYLGALGECYTEEYPAVTLG